MTGDGRMTRVPGTSAGDSGTFVGRDAELAAILDAVRLAGQGAGRLVLLSGPAGIGKSRLVREVVSRARSRMATGTGDSPPDLAVPALWPVRRALSSLLRQQLSSGEVSSDVSTLIREALGSTDAEQEERRLGGRGAASEAPPSWERLVRLESLVDRLLAMSCVLPCLLVLEDLQWADAETVSLLRLLAPVLESHSLAIIATVRGAAGEGERLARLARSPGTDAYALGPLARSDIADYLRALGHPTAPADEVHRLSGGLPLLVPVAVATAASARSSGGGDPLPVENVGLRTLVDRLVEPLSAETLAALTTGTVVGTDLDVERLSVSADISEVAARDALLAGLAAGLLVASGEGGQRFTHELVRSTLHGRETPGAVRAAHRRLGLHLATHGATPVEVAGHLDRAAGTEEEHRDAARWWMGAAERADATFALDEAVAHRRAAVRSLHRGAAAKADIAQALLDLANAEHRAGHHGEAVGAGERASLLAAEVGRADLMASAALVAPWVSFPAATEALTRLCRAALAREADLDLATRSRLRSKLVVLTVERSWPEAGETAATAMDLAVRSADPEALLDAAGAATTVLPECDVAGRRLGLADLAIAEATRLDRPMGLVIALNWRLRAAVELGRADLVEECLKRLTAVAEASGIPLAHWHSLRARASVAVLRGDFSPVPDLNARASAIAGRSGDVVAVGMSYASARHVDEVRWVAGPDLEDTLLVMAAAPASPLMDTGRGLELLRAGRREEAEAAYRRVVPLVGTSPSTRPWMPAVQQLITLAEAFDDRALAPGLVVELRAGAQLEGGVGISTAYFTGSVSRDLGRALALAGLTEEAVAELRRSIVRNTRLGALPDVALGRLDLARVLARKSTGPGGRQDAGMALDLATTALEELRRLDMPGHLPRAASLVAELQGVLAAVDPLSSREREVVDLVVAGRTNREIADRLVLSERTIESHVRSALMKRGCRNRAELIRAETADTGSMA